MCSVWVPGAQEDIWKGVALLRCRKGSQGLTKASQTPSCTALACADPAQPLPPLCPRALWELP